MSTKTKSVAAAKDTPAHQPQPSSVLPLNRELLKRLYYYMVKCRMVGQRAQLLFRQDKVVPNCSFSLGPEAIAVGAAIDLKPEDAVAPWHHALVAKVMKRAPLQQIYAELHAGTSSSVQRGSSRAEADWAALHVIPPSSTCTAQLNLGTGVALAYKMQKRRNIVIALADEDGANLESWQEALTFAGVHKLPIVYVIENLWEEEAAPAEPQAKMEDLSLRAEALGIPGITVDGNDAVAVYRVCYEARELARQGGGPTLVECKTYPWHEDSINLEEHESAEKMEQWGARDPIAHMQGYLQKQGLWSEEWNRQILGEIKHEIDEAMESTRKRGALRRVKKSRKP